MKLPPLPPMRAPGAKPRPKPAAKAQDAPAEEAYVPFIELPSLKPGKNTWGAAEVGRWFEVRKKDRKKTGVEVGGVCCRCGRTMPSKELRWGRWPFQEDEGWACGPCRKERRGLEATTGTSKPEERTTVPKSKKVKNVREWLAQSGRDPLGWYGPTPYSEERQAQLEAHSRWLGWMDEREQRESDWESEGGR